MGGGTQQASQCQGEDRRPDWIKARRLGTISPAACGQRLRGPSCVSLLPLLPSFSLLSFPFSQVRDEPSLVTYCRGLTAARVCVCIVLLLYSIRTLTDYYKGCVPEVVKSLQVHRLNRLASSHICLRDVDGMEIILSP